MKKAEKSYDVGVVIGRFQVDRLHAGHIDLLQTVSSSHPRMIVFLGIAGARNTADNPLDFEARKQMILSTFPTAIVLPIRDRRDDGDWSKELDNSIADMLAPGQTAVLYGGRDSFVRAYSGRYPTQELVQDVFISGSYIRNHLSKSVCDTPEFRAGVIWGAHNRYPTCYTTVDVAIFNEDYTRLLLARKPGEKQYRFIGGFSDPGSDSFENDARREVDEETGLEIGELRYLGSAKVDDWRYRGSRDCIKTVFFASKLVFGRPTPADDIEELRWFDVGTDAERTTLKHNVVPEHVPLLHMLVLRMAGN